MSVAARGIGDLGPAIERLLDDAELRAQMGAAAREKARREWSWDASTDALLAAYEAAATSSRSTA